MARQKGKAKGNAFERLICKTLSLWWTDNERDDIFWRSTTSGARATTRAKQRGETTAGQYGDITAIDACGQPLLERMIIEVKKGYAGKSLFDLVDRLERHQPLYEKFLRQAFASCRQAGASYWLLIARRDGRKICVYMPRRLFLKLKHCLSGATPLLRMAYWVTQVNRNTIYVTTLDEFLLRVKREDIETLLLDRIR